MINASKSIHIYTDGSCHPQLKTGCWAAIILRADGETIIHGAAENTTHQRMELTAIIEAIDHINGLGIPSSRMVVFSDSQYATDLPGRKDKLIMNHFRTASGNTVKNEALVKALLDRLASNAVRLVKVAAHPRKSDVVDYHRKVDLIVRKLLRKEVALSKGK